MNAGFSAGVLCGPHGLFGGSEELIGARILLPAINVIYKETPRDGRNSQFMRSRWHLP